MTDLPKTRGWTIGRKLMVIVSSCISAGFAVLIAVQIQSFSQYAHDVLMKKDQHLSELLAAQVSQGVRWRNPSVIERAYRPLTRDPESGLSAIVALDAGGRALSAWRAERHGDIDLLAAFDGIAARPDEGRDHVSESGDHIIVFIPIVATRAGFRVGTLGIAWSLEPLHARVFGELRRQVGLGVLTVVGLIALMILILHRVVSRPLNAVTEATLHLAEGDIVTRIPCSERRDEVGDLARSLMTFKCNLETIDSLSEEQKVQTGRLAEALEKERGYNRLQREFVAMASHEFRTPLTIIDSGAQRIERRLEQMDAEQIADKVRQIRNAVQRMTTLIESVLSSASFDAGKFKVEVEQCNLKDIVEKACRQQQDMSRSHRITVDLEQLPEEVMGDARLLEQVFSNLLSNAVKYAPNNPGIEVVGTLLGREACVAITDHGVGIPEAEQARVFDRYFRASTATGIAGTGIGLNLVAQTVELHGGHVDLASAVGEGTTVTVHLPVRKLADSTPGSGTAAPDPYQSNPFDTIPV